LLFDSGSAENFAPKIIVPVENDYLYTTKTRGKLSRIAREELDNEGNLTS
jgi:hypothetical protein